MLAWPGYGQTVHSGSAAPGPAGVDPEPRRDSDLIL